MLKNALTHIKNQLNQYFKRTFAITEEIAVLSNIVEQDGSVPTLADNKLIISLVNIEHETRVQTIPARNGGFSGVNPKHAAPIHLNLYVMFSANFASGNYEEALKFLSHTITFFQKNPVFTRQSTPDLDPAISKLILDIENLNVKDLSSLWSVISSKYIPSILYRIRMVTIDSGDVRSTVPVMTKSELTAGS